MKASIYWHIIVDGWMFGFPRNICLYLSDFQDHRQSSNLKQSWQEGFAISKRKLCWSWESFTYTGSFSIAQVSEKLQFDVAFQYSRKRHFPNPIKSLARRNLILILKWQIDLSMKYSSIFICGCYLYDSILLGWIFLSFRKTETVFLPGRKCLLLRLWAHHKHKIFLNLPISPFPSKAEFNWQPVCLLACLELKLYAQSVISAYLFIYSLHSQMMRKARDSFRLSVLHSMPQNEFLPAKYLTNSHLLTSTSKKAHLILHCRHLFTTLTLR